MVVFAAQLPYRSRCLLRSYYSCKESGLVCPLRPPFPSSLDSFVAWEPMVATRTASFACRYYYNWRTTVAFLLLLSTITPYADKNCCICATDNENKFPSFHNDHARSNVSAELPPLLALPTVPIYCPFMSSITDNPGEALEPCVRCWHNHAHAGVSTQVVHWPTSEWMRFIFLNYYLCTFFSFATVLFPQLKFFLLYKDRL